MTISLQPLFIHRKGGAGPRSLHTTLEGTNGVCGMQDACTVYVISYMVSNGSCFTFTWTIFKNRLSKVGLTQNRETMALWRITTVDLFYLSCVRTRMNRNSIEIAFSWGPGHIWFHTTLEGRWLHYMVLEVCWGQSLDTLFSALTISWSRTLARVWSGPKVVDATKYLGPVLRSWSRRTSCTVPSL
jgi:hypothetical protein